MPKINVPSEAYEAFSSGEITREELTELEKFAEYLSKEASPTFGQMAGLAIAAPSLAYLGSKIPEAIESARNNASFNSDFNRILKVNPSLGSSQDPNLQMAYKTLRTLSPTYAKDPLLAGTILGNVMHNRTDPDDPSSPPRFDPALVNEIVRGTPQPSGAVRAGQSAAAKSSEPLAKMLAMGRKKEEEKQKQKK